MRKTCFIGLVLSLLFYQCGKDECEPPDPLKNSDLWGRVLDNSSGDVLEFKKDGTFWLNTTTDSTNFVREGPYEVTGGMEFCGCLNPPCNGVGLTPGIISYIQLIIASSNDSICSVDTLWVYYDSFEYIIEEKDCFEEIWLY